MNAKKRLHDVQVKLVARGVKDVKFFFDKAKLGLPSKALEGAANLTEAYEQGRFSVAHDYVKPVDFVKPAIRA